MNTLALARYSHRLYSTMSQPISSPFTRAVVSSMRKLYPESLAEKSWDNTGLLLEAPFNHTRRQKNSVLLAIDLTTAVADEAIARRDSIVVAYHPIIFRGLKSLTFNDPQQSTLLRLATEGISVYSPHTAIDATPGGMADWLCDIVTGAIAPTSASKPSIQKSSSAHYSHLTFPHPQPATPATPVPHVRNTIIPSPPPVPEGMESAGMGRIVTFDEPQPLTAIVDRIAQGVGYPGGIPIAIPQTATVEDLKIRTVGVCPGSGSSVLLKGTGGKIPDVLFTGELSHHEALAAVERGSVVIALAHTNTERGYLRAVMREKLARAVQTEWEAQRAEGLKDSSSSSSSSSAADSDLKQAFDDAECIVDVSERDRDPYGIMIRQV
ncbi:NIF3-domain-containing protein [Aspergillus heteromorphus CBS 117.55]|uniref:NIF3-domain-containing protein n=1 Tax=Aspergillus heteromorphus CBS 117.55 TaxID=1448321 RepID=A0A317WPW4_9EURO|nr:NIF3-domain-containing protein [Aspergillus heteromorphus CBS 117.55]PWY88463.1 NIF3-domain-containing protein [Aspergillus heteromorphus CBS 117.55]